MFNLFVCQVIYVDTLIWTTIFIIIFGELGQPFDSNTIKKMNQLNLILLYYNKIYKINWKYKTFVSESTNHP